MTFEQWMKQVDRAVENVAYVSLYDLPDINYRDLFDSGETPDNAAREALEYSDYPTDFSN